MAWSRDVKPMIYLFPAPKRLWLLLDLIDEIQGLNDFDVDGLSGVVKDITVGVGYIVSVFDLFGILANFIIVATN